ncbi:MAG: hypothetical protein MJ097_00660 [Dorea sp.]|nr:hypothetical protein [Dorea sp.]
MNNETNENDIIIGSDFEPILVAHAITHSYVEVQNSDIVAGLTGSKTRLENRFTLEELEAIAKHIMIYVDMVKASEKKE